MISDTTSEDYHGHQLFRFNFAGTEAIIVVPKQPLPTKNWLWKGLYFDAFPQFEVAMLDAGFHLVFVKSKTTFPVPPMMTIWDKFYDFLTTQQGFPPKAILFGLSRGAYFLYTWAVNNTDKIACIYADNPMCNFKSTYLAGGVKQDLHASWETLLREYGFASLEDALSAPSAGPVDELAPLAEAKIPILHVAATDDEIVPYEENTALLATNYRKLGGKIKVISHPGNHHPHGLTDPTPIVEFCKTWMDGSKTIQIGIGIEIEIEI